MIDGAGANMAGVQLSHFDCATQITADVKFSGSPAALPQRIELGLPNCKLKLGRPGQQHMMQRIVFEDGHRAAWPHHTPELP